LPGLLAILVISGNFVDLNSLGRCSHVSGS
jgi:hypothetical protein